MSDKCQSHDICMGGINDSLDEIKDMLRDGRVVHAEHELRIDRLEEGNGGWGWKSNLLRFVFGLLEKGIILLLGMAYYAHKVGWGQ